MKKTAALEEFRKIVTAYHNAGTARQRTYWAFAMDGAAKILTASGITRRELDALHRRGEMEARV